MRYCGDLKTKMLDADWMEFAVDNRLQVNDACVFELVTGSIEEVVFQMEIFHGCLSKEITSKGATADGASGHRGLVVRSGDACCCMEHTKQRTFACC